MIFSLQLQSRIRAVELRIYFLAVQHFHFEMLLREWKTSFFSCSDHEDENKVEGKKISKFLWSKKHTQSFKTKLCQKKSL